MAEMTTRQFADHHEVDYIVASNVLKFLHEKSIVKEVRRQKSSSGRGRPTIVYEVPLTVDLNLCDGKT